MNSNLLALYGGTFDPIHLGHIQVAQAARSACGFASVRLLPAADPPLRPPPGASAAHRVAMVRLACEGLPGFEVDDRELRRSGPSFTVDTLAEVRAEIGPERPLVWLLGRDAISRIDRWHRHEALLRHAHFLVLDRPGWTDDGAGIGAVPAPAPAAVRAWVQAHRRDDLRQLHMSPAGGLFFFDGPRIPISATAVRAACATAGNGPSAGEPAAASLLAPNVWSYICRHGLYGACAELAPASTGGTASSSAAPSSGPELQ